MSKSRHSNEAGPAAYRAHVQALMARVGMGFHPDTSINQYVEFKSGEPCFSAAEVALFEDQREEAYKLGGFDEYKIAIEETELYMAATVTK